MSFLGETLQAGVHSPQEFLKRLLAGGNSHLFLRATHRNGGRQPARFTEIFQSPVSTRSLRNMSNRNSAKSEHQSTVAEYA